MKKNRKNLKNNDFNFLKIINLIIFITFAYLTIYFGIKLNELEQTSLEYIKYSDNLNILNKTIIYISIFVFSINLIIWINKFTKILSDRKQIEKITTHFRNYKRLPQHTKMNLVKTSNFLETGNSKLFKAILLKMINFEIIEIEINKSKVKYYLNEENYEKLNDTLKLKKEEKFIFNFIYHNLDKRQKENGFSGEYFEKLISLNQEKIFKEIDKIKKEDKKDLLKTNYFKSDADIIENKSLKYKRYLIFFITASLIVAIISNIIVKNILITWPIIAFVLLIFMYLGEEIINRIYEKGITSKGLQIKYELLGLKNYLSEIKLKELIADKRFEEIYDYLILATFLGVDKKIYFEIQKLDELIKRNDFKLMDKNLEIKEKLVLFKQYNRFLERLGNNIASVGKKVKRKEQFNSLYDQDVLFK